MSVTRDTALRFERLHTGHIPELLEIEAEAYPDPWTFGMFQQEITNSISRFYVAYTEDLLVGYAGFWLVADEVHITKVTVIAACRGQGYGRDLVRHLLHVGAALGGTTARLEVRESNLGARRLYEQLGFRVVGVRKGYYARSQEAALVMMKEIGGATDQ